MRARARYSSPPELFIYSRDDNDEDHRAPPFARELICRRSRSLAGRRAADEKKKARRRRRQRQEERRGGREKNGWRSETNADSCLQFIKYEGFDRCVNARPVFPVSASRRGGGSPGNGNSHVPRLARTRTLFNGLERGKPAVAIKLLIFVTKVTRPLSPPPSFSFFFSSSRWLGN